MKRIHIVIMFLGLALVVIEDPAYSQREKYLIGTRQLPDSVKGQLADKVDETRIKRNWGKLRRGLPPKTVESLFGKPTRIASSVYDHSTTWYYGRHSVVFDAIKDVVRLWEVER